jgi:DNA-directed RNA polymerase specialized sigma24 family protein
LATITGRKVIDRRRQSNMQKRGGGQGVGDSALLSNDSEGSSGFDQFRGDAPTPEVLAIAAEEFQRLMAMLDDDRFRQIAECKLEGYTNEEIAKQLGLACRSIERKLQRIRRVWEGELEE